MARKEKESKSIRGGEGRAGGGLRCKTHHHAGQSSISRHWQVPHSMPRSELAVAQHDQQRSAAPKASAHSGAHCTSGHHLNHSMT